MGIKRAGSNDPSTELRVTKEKLKASLQREKELEKVINDLHKKDAEFKHTLEDHGRLFTQLKLKEQEVEFMHKAIEQSNQKIAEKNKNGKIVSFFGDILILVSTTFSAWGINYITSTPPNSIGW